MYSLANQNRFYKKSASFCLRAVARHSPELAQAVTDCGALDSMVTCLEDFDPGVKEGAAWALGYIAAHNAVRTDPLMLCSVRMRVVATPAICPCFTLRWLHAAYLPHRHAYRHNFLYEGLEIVVRVCRRWRSRS